MNFWFPLCHKSLKIIFLILALGVYQTPLGPQTIQDKLREKADGVIFPMCLVNTFYHSRYFLTIQDTFYYSSHFLTIQDIF